MGQGAILLWVPLFSVALVQGIFLSFMAKLFLIGDMA